MQSPGFRTHPSSLAQPPVQTQSLCIGFLLIGFHDSRRSQFIPITATLLTFVVFMMHSHRSHDGHHLYSPLSTEHRHSASNTKLTQAQLLYAIGIIIGLFALFTNPILIVVALLCLGYGRFYHLESAKSKPHLPWTDKHGASTPTIRLGPSSPPRGSLGSVLDEQLKSIHRPSNNSRKDKTVRFAH